MNNDAHLSDAELLQFMDREASARDAARMEIHLTGCWQCRSRRAELERAISSYVRVHRTGAQMPPMDESRARLLAALVRLASANPPVRPKATWQPRLFAYGGAAACLVAALGLVMYFSVEGAGAASVPDESLTPGVTREVTKEDICSPGVREGFYPIPANVAVSVFQQYRIENPQPRSYEVDYLITPSLGGADDIRNLWPQPYASGEWNAHVKDALEHHLHDLVCTGRLDLKTAQRDIASNWIAAYRKYFKTDRPLADHTGFSVDPPWEN
jgi:hypothetical protein